MGFDVAFGGYSDIDPRYGKVQVNHFTKQRVVNETTGELCKKRLFKNKAHTHVAYTYATEELEIVKCGYEHFNYPRKNESAYGDVASLYCIKVY